MRCHSCYVDCCRVLRAPEGVVGSLVPTASLLLTTAVADAGKQVPRTTFIVIGALLTSLAVLPGDVVMLALLIALWLLAGVGQNWVNLPSGTLLAERTDVCAQGRVYGSHFAWSHLWWGFAYPLTGWLSVRFPERPFLHGG